VDTVHAQTGHLLRCIQDFFFNQFLNYDNLAPLFFSRGGRRVADAPHGCADVLIAGGVACGALEL
jgi:hypothetical protein